MDNMIDTHCHILPGLDDGASDEGQALEMARIAVADGITGIVATPHDIPGLFPFDQEKANEELLRLKSRLDEEKIKLLLFSGCEVAVTHDLERRCTEGRLQTFAGRGRHLLVELPLEEIPPYTDEVFYKLQLRGLVPVLAHPERNLDLLRHPGRVRGMVERGVLIQISAPSITGMFGRKVKNLTEELARRGLVHLVASDAHTPGKRAPRLQAARNMLGNFLTSEALAWLFEINPQLIVDGKELKSFDGGDWLKRKSTNRSLAVVSALLRGNDHGK